MRLLPFIRAPLVLGLVLVSASGATVGGQGNDSKITWLLNISTLQVTITNPDYSFAGIQIRTDRQVTAALESVNYNGAVFPTASFTLSQLDNSIWLTPMPDFQSSFLGVNAGLLNSNIQNPVNTLQLDLRLGTVFSGGFNIPPALEIFLQNSQYGNLALNSAYTGYTDAPEPATFLLFGVGLVALGFWRRRLRV